MERKNRTYYHTKEVSNFCVICGIEFTSTRKAKCCSERCRQVHRHNQKMTGAAGIDYIKCPECGQKVKQLTVKHVKLHGYSTIWEFKQKYNLNKVSCQSIIESNSGENNPGYQHGGKFSKFSKNFVHGYDEQWHKEWAKTHSEFRNHNKKLFKTNIEYWITECNGNVEKAQEMYLNFQVRDLSYFVDKYGEEEGTIRHQQKIDRWAKSMPNFNYSMVSQELFDRIMKSYINADSDIYYATYHRDDMKRYENKEYRLKTKTSYVMPDFIDLSKKRIIEFDGDYWHSEAKVNPERERKRHEQIVSAGFEVMYVREQDYKKDKDKVIDECLQFLTK